ncbi:unnamed protein product [Pylaiella littoralis]
MSYTEESEGEVRHILPGVGDTSGGGGDEAERAAREHSTERYFSVRWMLERERAREESDDCSSAFAIIPVGLRSPPRAPCFKLREFRKAWFNNRIAAGRNMPDGAVRDMARPYIARASRVAGAGGIPAGGVHAIQVARGHYSRRRRSGNPRGVCMTKMGNRPGCSGSGRCVGVTS